MAKIKRLDSSVVTLMDTELNSLGSLASTQSITAFDNSDTDFYGDIELVVPYGLRPDVGPHSDIFIKPSVDGVNYPGSGSVIPQGALYIGTIQNLRDTNGKVLRAVLPRVSIPAGLIKFWIKNLTNTSYISSGNTLKIRPNRFQIEA